MIYVKTEYNILQLLNIVGTLEREQIITFFEDYDYSRERLEYVLKKLSDRNYLTYDSTEDTYSSSTAPEVVNEIKRRRIKAFWVIANLKNAEVLQIVKLEYPSQFLFITKSNLVYDVTVCYDENDAAVASNFWKKGTNPEISDKTIHIGVVNDDDLGKRLKNYGFDCYCIVDNKTHEVLYEAYN